jgi:hypothetical protein
MAKVPVAVTATNSQNGARRLWVSIGVVSQLNQPAASTQLLRLRATLEAPRRGRSNQCKTWRVKSRQSL